MKADEWNKGIEAWEKVRKQAEIDMEQADLYIQAIKNKIKTLPLHPKDAFKEEKKEMK